MKRMAGERTLESARGKKVKLEPSLLTQDYFDARIDGIVDDRLQEKATDHSGLRDAVELFDLSLYPYDEEHRSFFYVLVSVFENPLCEAIYRARLRVFSDYAQMQEPIDSIFAQNIIMKLSVVDEHARVGVFFNALAKLRPFPVSQKYLLDVDIPEHVSSVLKKYCLSMINDIKTMDDYNKISNTIRRLKTRGGDQVIFDAIKYRLGALIESEDWASTRDFETLMAQVWCALAKPQPFLGDFREELESSRPYRRIASRAIQRLSPIMESFVSNEADCGVNESGDDHGTKHSF